MPNVIRETSQGFSLIPLGDEMLQHRELECVGSINAETAYSLCRQLRYLQRENPEGEITLFINSPGGEVQSGLAIYDTMQGIRCPIRTVCLGRAASMAALLFAAGDRRDILPHGQVMIHDPLTGRGIEGSALQVQEASREMMKTREALAKILARHTGQDLEEIYRKTERDTYFTAEEAVAFGLADRIIHEI